MPRILRSKNKNENVQTLSPRKKLQLVTDDKENSIDMGHHKMEEPVKPPKKASTLKNLKKENPSIPRTSKRRNALRDVVKNTETSEEELTLKCAQVKSKNRTAETKKVAKSGRQKACKTNLTQVKLNFPSISSPVNEENVTVANAEIPAPVLNEAGCVTKSFYQEKESSFGSDACNKTFDELLEAAKKDDAYELEKPTLQSFMINSPSYNKSLLEVDMLTSATPPDSYWKELAQQREVALERTLKENESLRDQLEVLQIENVMLKNIVQQAEELACIVKGIVE